MTDEAAGVPTSRNDDARQDDLLPHEQAGSPAETPAATADARAEGTASAGSADAAEAASMSAFGADADAGTTGAGDGSGGGSVDGSGVASAGEGSFGGVGEGTFGGSGTGSADASGAGDGTGVGDASGVGDGSGAPEARGEGDGGGDERPEARLARAVRVAEQALIEFEIAVETFRVEVENFSRLHHQRLGPMYARLDELDAQIAEARAARTGDPEDLRKAQDARSMVLPMPGVDELFHDWIDSDGLSPEAAAMLTEQPVRPPKRVRPTDEARKLYRELARKAHPDLAQDETERARREEFITRVNGAYGRGDEALLRELAEEWAAGPVQPEAELGEADELYARLNWLTQRKELLTVLAQELEESAIGAMLRMAPDDPDQLLEEIAEQLLGEVARRENELAALVQ